MGAMNGGLGASMANGSAASSMDALTQAYSGMQQYTASALPSLYGQSLLQQSVAGSQKEGEQILSTCQHTLASHLHICHVNSPIFTSFHEHIYFSGVFFCIDDKPVSVRI